MINIRILCIGNIKEKFYVDAIAEYKKRLTRFCNIEIIELKEEKKEITNDSDIAFVKSRESARILEKMSGYNIVLDIKGKAMGSVELATMVKQISNNSSTITFVIGGSYGLTDDVKTRANMLLSFGAMTYPHQLMRVILTEQIYRVFAINNNITYHK